MYGRRERILFMKASGEKERDNLETGYIWLAQEIESSFFEHFFLVSFGFLSTFFTLITIFLRDERHE